MRFATVSTSRISGYTLVEVLIAIMVFTIGALGLAATSASIARQMGLNADRSAAGAMALNRAERFQASDCDGNPAGTDESRGVRSEWSVTKGVKSAELDHRITRRSSASDRVDRFRSGVLCE